LAIVVVCCTFCTHVIATNSDAKLNDIEKIEKKVDALKAERLNIENKQFFILNEKEIIFKKMDAIKNKLEHLEHNKASNVAYFKGLIEKKENNIELLKHRIASIKLEIDIDKINLKIDKANIELIKAEIKAGKTPKIPLDLAKSLIKRTMSWIKLNETTIKIKQAEIKENVANIKYFENILETGEKSREINKNTNHSYAYIQTTNIEIAELYDKRAMLILKLEQARKATAYAKIKEAQAGVEFCKLTHKVCKTFLKFNKSVDRNNFISFLNHN
jgi:predicted ABC-type ATPase